jgi:hypothetical protein
MTRGEVWTVSGARRRSTPALVQAEGAAPDVLRAVQDVEAGGPAAASHSGVTATIGSTTWDG